MDYRYKLPFDAARAERAYLEPPGELVDEEEENTLDLSNWDDHRIVVNLYFQANDNLKALLDSIQEISARKYRKGEHKDNFIYKFDELQIYMNYATVCQDWLSHEKAGTLDELTDVEKKYWEEVIAWAYDCMQQWFDESNSDEGEGEIEPPEDEVYKYGIDIMSAGDDLLPQVLVEINKRFAGDVTWR